MKKEYKGIDISVWNGNINWKSVKKDGVDFAIIRISSSTFLDKKFIQNIEGALAEKIPCGVYVYSYAETIYEAQKEAEFAIKSVEKYAIDLPLVYDIEDKVHHSLSNKERTDLSVAFCSEIQSAKYKPCVYSSLSWFNTMLDLNRLKQYDNWVAQWGNKCTFTGDIHIWQNSNKGVIDGIKGDVDLNIAYKSYTNTDSGLIIPSPPTITTPTDKPVNNLDKSPEKTELKAGYPLSLNEIPMYISATTTKKSGDFNGKYYVYDTKKINGRIRLTTSIIKVGAKPEWKNITGYANISDLPD